MINVKTWAKRVAGLSVLGMAAFMAGSPTAEAGPPVAGPGTSTNTFNVKASVTGACVLSTTPDLTFPAYLSNSATAVTSSSTFTISCPSAATTPVPVTLTFGGAGSSFQMASTGTPADTLNYALYQAADLATAYTWNTAGNPITVNTASFPYQLWGKIPAPQAAVVHADYTQALTATLSY
jgi:spore coat protein U-like protein